MIRYTARHAGPVEEVYACRVFGMACPLGFALKGKNRVRFFVKGPTTVCGLGHKVYGCLFVFKFDRAHTLSEAK